MILMHEDEVPHWVAPAEPEPPRRPGPFLILPADLVERTIAATAAFAHFAGDARMLGLHDAEIVHPVFEAGLFRDMRAVRRELLEEFAADDERGAHARNLSRRLPVTEPDIRLGDAPTQEVPPPPPSRDGAPAGPDREALARVIYGAMPQHRLFAVETLQPTTGVAGRVDAMTPISWDDLPARQRDQVLVAADAVAALVAEARGADAAERESAHG